MKYLLTLANGCSWELGADAEARSWLAQLAQRMQLKRTTAIKAAHRLTFVRHFELPDSNEGWLKETVGKTNFFSHPNAKEIFCEIGAKQSDAQDIARMWQGIAPINRCAWETGGFPIHAALIEYAGHGFLLAAHSGTGKTTSCLRLPLPWVAHSDDEALIIPGKKNQYRAHPLPSWSIYIDKSKNMVRKSFHFENHVPVRALFFLRRGGTDEAMPLKQGAALSLLMAAALHAARRNMNRVSSPYDLLNKKTIFENAGKFVLSVPAFNLSVSLNGSFWEEIKRVAF